MQERGRLTRFHSVSQDRRNWLPATEALTERASSVAHEITQPVPTAVPDVVSYRPFPVAVLVLLHFMTGGVFTFFWITCMHGRLPKLQPHHPSGGRAVLFSMLPLVNLFWAFLCYPVLADRLNELRRRHELRGAIPRSLVVTAVVMLVFPAVMAIIGGIVVWMMMARSSNPELNHPLILFFAFPNILTLIDMLILIPAVAGMFQSSFNEIAAAQQSQLFRHANISE
jgi:hypothetical protein